MIRVRPGKLTFPHVRTTRLAEAHRQGRSIGSINRKVMELANENDTLRPDAVSAGWRARVMLAAPAWVSSRGH
jgi:hypothetical protein